MNFLLHHLRWVALTVITCLGLALFSVLQLEVQQRSELSRVTEFAVENQLWQFFQLRSEYQSLREEVLKLRQQRSPEQYQLVRRWQDIFVGRINMLRDQAFTEIYRDAPEMEARLEQLSRRAEAVDAHVAAMERPQGPERLQKAVFALQEDVNFIVQEARTQFVEHNSVRKQRIDEMAGSRIVLSVLEFTLLCVFAAFMFWALWRLEQRQEVQEGLSRQLGEALLAAESANDAKGRFLAHVSHEIRTPLTAILGYGQRLRESGGLAPRQQQWLERIASSGEYLQNLLNNVLELSRIEAGKAELQQGALSMSQLTRELDALFREQARRKGLYLELRVDPGVDDVLILDTGKIRQILVNLIGNAIKMTMQGGVHVSFWQTLDAKSNPWLHAAVRDTGPGIPPEAAQRVFRPFEQSLDGKRAGGSGLGLAISREFAELMGGTLHFDSKLGAGTSFFLQLPVRHNTQEGGQSEPSCSSTLTGLHILIVDDQEMNLDLLDDLLQRAGATAAQELDGYAALSRMLTEGFDAVIVDYHMPLMNGLQLARALRAREFSGRIILSTAGMFPEADVMEKAGIDGAIGKPFVREQILAALAPEKREQPSALLAPVAPGNELQVADTRPLWSLTPAANALGYAPARFLGLAERGLQRIGDLLQSWPQASAEGDRHRLAHTCKGIAGQVGALALQQACLALEQEPEDSGRFAECMDCWQRSREAWPRASEEWRSGS
ncbi:ATP-binding protein [Chitinilyticum piscinae]|uniref:Virulence sensor protein BvgS n=1 Tax=Chitinilyticum piscinae TaxID=2866724 RepID=A0A8J7FTF0_9NEIS|nr:ATP-binding protein [Chitinilyticum piscinae]MBE9610221.1 response regulator [Chitinilyticum piscinae]